VFRFLKLAFAAIFGGQMAEEPKRAGALLPKNDNRMFQGADRRLWSCPPPIGRRNREVGIVRCAAPRRYIAQIACRAQESGPEALAMPSRRRDAPASMDIGGRRGWECYVSRLVAARS
jgi:hypothetical protein